MCLILSSLDVSSESLCLETSNEGLMLPEDHVRAAHPFHRIFSMLFVPLRRKLGNLVQEQGLYGIPPVNMHTLRGRRSSRGTDSRMPTDLTPTNTAGEHVHSPKQTLHPVQPFLQGTPSHPPHSPTVSPPPPTHCLHSRLPPPSNTAAHWQRAPTQQHRHSLVARLLLPGLPR